MADGVKISDMPNASSPSGADVLAGVQNNRNKKFSLTTLLQWIKDNLSLTAADVGAVDTADVGVADGVASLDNTGKVPPSQLPTIPSDASDITYDPTTSGLSATDVQDAIDEVQGEIGNLPSPPAPSDANPQDLGTAAAGSSTDYSRADHVHNKPSAADIGAQSAITASGILKGDGAGGVTAATPGQDYQAPLTFDATPTASSANPVQSGGVYTDVRTRVPNYGKGKNLLRNWYFLNPVNQRGTVSASAASGYFIDGWTNYGIYKYTASIQSGGIQLTGQASAISTLYQDITDQIDGINGKQVTLSILTAEDGLRAATGVVSLTASVSNNLIVYGNNSRVLATLLGSTGVLGVNLRVPASETATFKAVKLELGTEQTLAHQENGAWVLNEISDYEAELIKCQTSTADSSDTYANKSLATRQDLTSIQATGTTNTTGAAIPAGALFYLNGILHRAKEQIGTNVLFTPGTNCVQVTEGGLNATQGKLHLVWTNTGTSVAFAGQTLPLDLSQYDLVLVEHLPERSLVSAKQAYVCRIGNGTDNIQSMYLPSGATTPSLYQRTISVTTSGVTFGDGFAKPTTATARTTNNNAIHPRTIYGIKL